MTIYVMAKPGTRKNSYIVVNHNTLKINIATSPIDGKANQELINYLAEIFLVNKSKIHFIKGSNSRYKKFEIDAEINIIKKIFSDK